jgi:hypothetical protein
MTQHTRQRLLTSLLAVFVLGVGAASGAVSASASPAGAAAMAPAAPGAAADNGVDDVVACNGGAQERALTRMDDQPTTIAEDVVFVALPGAAVPFNVPAGDNDQIIVTFSAEAVLGGQTTPLTVPTDSIQLQILLDGAVMFPLNDLNFTTDAGHANAIEACRRVGEGNHVVTVEWFLFDQGAASVLTGTLDDWTLHVEIND